MRSGPLDVVLVFAHANVFRYWFYRALQLHPEAWLRVSLSHVCLSGLLVEQTSGLPTARFSVQALRVGDDGQLPVAFLFDVCSVNTFSDPVSYHF